MNRKQRGKARRSARARRRERRVLTVICVILALIMAGLCAYIALWYLNLGRIHANEDRYRQMYGGRSADAVPTAAPVEETTGPETPTLSDDTSAEPPDAPAMEATATEPLALSDDTSAEPPAAPAVETKVTETPAPAQNTVTDPTEASFGGVQTSAPQSEPAASQATASQPGPTVEPASTATVEPAPAASDTSASARPKVIEPTEAPAAATLLPPEGPSVETIQAVTVMPVPTIDATAEPIPDASPTPTIVASTEPTPTGPPTPTIDTSAEPTPTASPAPTSDASAEPIPDASPAPTIVTSAEPTPTASPTPASEGADAPEAVPAANPTAPTPEPTATADPEADMPVVMDEPIPTPGPDTLVLALPTAPPVQSSFDALLAHNPDTVAYLEIEDMLSLPVVQRANDNEHYLNHTFDGDEASEGALFMDGLNRLVPEDDCLIVYGHNMKNHTMFGRLSAFSDLTWLKRHPIVHFDTLYENRVYVPFAAFSASTAPGNARYFDVRRFIFDDAEFEAFTKELKRRSALSIPLDVVRGDRLLLLVTCEYTNASGRFILALRQLRPDETESGVWAQLMDAKAR